MPREGKKQLFPLSFQPSCGRGLPIGSQTTLKERKLYEAWKLENFFSSAQIALVQNQKP